MVSTGYHWGSVGLCIGKSHARLNLMCAQNELDSIRSELAALRQAVGKNRSADDSAANGGRHDAMPGGNMV